MIEHEFKPTIWHPYYFIRKGLVVKISEYKHFLTGRMLDFGCGSKPYRSIIQVDEYIGVDYNGEGHLHDNEQIDIFYDGKTIPVEANNFDSALTSEVFEHVFNLEEILQELHRVLKPGAHILITCPFVWKEHEIPNDFARYTRFALKNLLENSGFVVEVEDKTGNFVEAVFQLQVLYLYDHLFPKVQKIPLIRPLFKLFFIAVPNIFGRMLSRVLPLSKTMYLNNVIVARNVKQ